MVATAAVGAKIRADDYNDIRNKVVKVLGPSYTSAATFGYGQTIVSSEVNTASKVSVNEWAELKYDIINAYVHQNGSVPTFSAVTEGDKVRYDTETDPTNPDAEPWTYWKNLVDGVETNAYAEPPLSQRISGNITPTDGSNTYSGSWGKASSQDTLRIPFTVSFTSAEEARHFFNSGGWIEITSSFDPGNSEDQNAKWESLLNSSTNVKFGGQQPQTGVNPNNGGNYFRCKEDLASTTAFYDNTASSPYGANHYRLYATTPGVTDNSTGTANTIEFVAEFYDGYRDTTEGRPGNPPPGDLVVGEFTVSVAFWKASGTLQPASAGFFEVESPGQASFSPGYLV